MKKHLVTTKELSGTRVMRDKGKKIKRFGKVRRFVFHPREKRIIGFMVKRPDLLLMFHRKDVFVAYNGYDIADGRVVIHNDPTATDKGAIEALGVDWDKCVLWVGLPIMTMKGDMLGYVGTVTYDAYTGNIESMECDDGLANDAIVGKRTIPAKMIKGFKRGAGMQMAPMGEFGEGDENAELGAVLVADEAASIALQGGAAAAAGEASAVIADKTKTAVDKAKPKVDEAMHQAGKAVNQGAEVMGKQLGKASTMFSDFKEEYDKAVGEEPKKPLKAGAKSGSKASKQGGSAAKTGGKSAGSTSKVAAKPASQKTGATKSTAKPAAKTAANSDNPPSAEDVGRAVGEHLSKVPGMFEGFKREYDKALKDDDEK